MFPCCNHICDRYISLYMVHKEGSELARDRWYVRIRYSLIKTLNLTRTRASDRIYVHI